MSIYYVTGDATCPQGDSTKVIVHICNDVGAWGRGFVLALSKRWKEPEQSYRYWYSQGQTSTGTEFKLGNTQFVHVTKDIYVANMIAQRGIKRNVLRNQLVDYSALESCLWMVNNYIKIALPKDTSIHMPRIGVGLGGGEWTEIVKCIEVTLSDIQVTVYDLDRN